MEHTPNNGIVLPLALWGDSHLGRAPLDTPIGSDFVYFSPN